MKKGAKPRDVDADNLLWFKRHQIKYRFTAETSLKTEPSADFRDLYGNYIRAPFPKEGVVRWGFLTEKSRDDFCKRFKAKAT